MAFNSKSKVEDLGYVKLIDPNPPGREMTPPEDLFLYVSLKATSKSRSVIVLEDDATSVSDENGLKDNEINFIATKIDRSSQDSDGKFTSYATTDYTDIGGLSIEGDEGSKENFGISSIDITYNTSLQPTVKIKFIDLRGSALFDISKSNLKNSQYGLFFKLPYPMFELTVKGYYGRPITYCLHMVDWTSSFNGDSANFEIDAEFIGFQSAFLADVNLQQVIGVSETKQGKAKLSGFTNDNFQTGTPKLADFISEISKIQISLEDIKAKVDKDGFDRLKNINTAYSLIQSLYLLIGGVKDGFNTTNTIVSPNFKTNDNIISVRDMIIIKSADKGYFKTFLETANNLLDDYKTFINKLESNTKYLVNDFISIDNPLISTTSFSAFTGELYKENSDVWDIATRDDKKPKPNEINNLSNVDEFIERYSKNFSKTTVVEVYDFSKTRENIKQIIDDLGVKVKEIKDDLNEKVNEEIKGRIDFNPTIENVFSIIMNNVQTMMECIYDVSLLAEQRATERYTEVINSGGKAGDCPNNDPNGEGYLYPWPLIVREEGEESPSQVWMETLNVDESLFPEIKFVNDVIDGYVKSSEELEELSDAVRDLRRSNSVDDWIPVNVEDIYTNPYAKFSIRKETEKLTDDVPNDLYKQIIKRAITLYGYSGVIKNGSSPLLSYASIDGANAASNIATKSFRKSISENLSFEGASKVINEEGPDFAITDSVNIQLIEPYLESEQSIIVGTEAKPIINNKVNLDVKNNENIENKLVGLKPVEGNISDGILYQNSSLLYEHNISYLVFNTQTRNNFNIPKIYDSIEKLNIGSITGLTKNGFGVGYNTNDSLDNRIDFLLDTIPFISFDVVNQLYINNDSNGVSKILILPKLYIAWLGYVLKNNSNPFPQTTIDSKTREGLVGYYEDWKENKASYFVDSYETFLANPEKSSGIEAKINEEDKMVITSPKKLNGDDLPPSMPIETFRNYLNKFINGFDEIQIQEEEKFNNNKSDTDNTANTSTNNDLKLTIYNYFKNIYDKWIGGTKDGKVFNSCISCNERDLIDQFQFVNSAWKDIGSEAVINLDSLVTLSDNIAIDLLTYVGKILRDSNFILQIFPSYINFDGETIKQMFEPNTTLNDVSSCPSYVCILANSNSKTLNITDYNRYYYEDDGFVFENGSMPPSFNKEVENESKNTGEYFRQLSNLVDKRGGVERILQGNDLYDLFATRSYKCRVDSLGNMNIQPLTYFQLDNVPFFRGAYMIMSVEHSITPNNMTTSFTGLRQSVNIVPVVKDATTFLNVDYNEEDDIAKGINRSSLLNEQDVVNYDYSVLNPNLPFTGNITAASLDALGVTEIAEGYREALSIQLNQQLIGKTNAYVCYFITQCLFESKNYVRTIEVWQNPKPDSNGVAKNGSSEQILYENNNNLGNNQSGDGLRFKGRGFLQITGRKNYQSAVENNESLKGLLTNYNTVNGYSSIDEFFYITRKKDGVLSIDEQGITNSLLLSLGWWDSNIKNLKQGTIAEFQETCFILNPRDGQQTVDERTKLFEEVLEQFSLKKFYDGSTTETKTGLDTLPKDPIGQ